MTTGIVENLADPHEHSVPVWTTVDNRGMNFCPLTSPNRVRSPIHRLYYNYTKV